MARSGVVLAAALALCGCAPTIGFICTAPTEDNEGTCAAPRYVPSRGHALWLRYEWTGPSPGVDSIRAMPGDSLRLKIPVSAVSLRVRGTRGLTGECDTMLLLSTIGRGDGR